MQQTIRRCDELGWLRIGRWGSAYRRSLWSRITKHGVELCSGREGDDSYVFIERTHPLHEMFEDLVSRQEFAVQHSRPGEYEEVLVEREEFEKAFRGPSVEAAVWVKSGIPYNV